MQGDSGRHGEVMTVPAGLMSIHEVAAFRDLAYLGTVDGQQPWARRVLKAVAVIVLILVVSAVLDLLLQHQARP
jgi:uncharacterized membrane protein